MPEVLKFHPDEVALRGVQLQPRLLQPNNLLLQVANVVFQHSREHKNIIYTNSHKSSSKFNPIKTRVINLRNMEGAFISLKGITQHSKSPCGMVKAVFGIQNPDAHESAASSRALKYQDLPNWSSRSSILSSGCRSGLVTALRALQSTLGLCPSFVP